MGLDELCFDLGQSKVEPVKTSDGMQCGAHVACERPPVGLEVCTKQFFLPERDSLSCDFAIKSLCVQYTAVCHVLGVPALHATPSVFSPSRCELLLKLKTLTCTFTPRIPFPRDPCHCQNNAPTY